MHPRHDAAHWVMQSVKHLRSSPAISNSSSFHLPHPFPLSLCWVLAPTTPRLTKWRRRQDCVQRGETDLAEGKGEHLWPEAAARRDDETA
ncbi:hypothetical protein ACOMHN_049738 [Nucella lapillus]